MTLADEDTKSILTDNANRAIQGKFSSEKKLFSEKKLSSEKKSSGEKRLYSVLYVLYFLNFSLCRWVWV